MPRQPRFSEPSTYLRYVGPVLGETSLKSTKHVGAENELRFIRLNARESPLKLQRRFAAVGPGSRSTLLTFSDLEMDLKHIAQCYVGVSYGSRARVFHTLDERILKWDQQTLDQVTEDDTANLEYDDSPIDDPRFEFWVSPGENNVPAFDLENVANDATPRRTLNLELLILAAKYTYEFVFPDEEPDIYKKLSTFQIPSRFVTFGGKI